MRLSSCKLLGSFITNRLFSNSAMDTKEKCLIRSAIHISLPDVLTISGLHQNLLHCILPFLEFWEHNTMSLNTVLGFCLFPVAVLVKM